MYFIKQQKPNVIVCIVTSALIRFLIYFIAMLQRLLIIILYVHICSFRCYSTLAFAIQTYFFYAHKAHGPLNQIVFETQRKRASQRAGERGGEEETAIEHSAALFHTCPQAGW